MRMGLVLLVFCTLFLSAPYINITYVLDQHHTHVTYTIDLQESQTITLPQDARDIHVNEELVANTHITLNKPSTITFTTQLFIEGVRRPYFIADLSHIPAKIDTVTLTLPPRAVLDVPLNRENPSIHPRPSSAYTDGEHMSFVWTGEELEPARAIFVRYHPTPQTNLLLIAAVAMFLIVLSIAFVTTRLKRRVQEKTMNLYGAEKTLVKILLDAPEDGMWQNELTTKSGLTKVNVSRKLRSLEQKGVIEKIPHGNTNRIRLS